MQSERRYSWPEALAYWSLSQARSVCLRVLWSLRQTPGGWVEILETPYRAECVRLAARKT
jgi:hypothetical protein